MSTTDELLEEMLEDAEEYATPVTDDDLQFWIDEHLRVISIPKNGVVAGVEGDKNVNKIKFGMNRYYHGFDMSTFSGRILYSNAKGNKNYYNITDMQASGSTITFSWLVDADAVQYMGKTAFVVYLFKIQGSELRQKFFSTLATLKVLEGMEVDSAVPVEKQTDIIERMKEEISAYAEEVKKSLPADYTAMTEQVNSLKEELKNYTTPEKSIEEKHLSDDLLSEIKQAGYIVGQDGNKYKITIDENGKIVPNRIYEIDTNGLLCDIQIINGAVVDTTGNVNTSGFAVTDDYFVGDSPMYGSTPECTNIINGQSLGSRTIVLLGDFDEATHVIFGNNDTMYGLRFGKNSTDYSCGFSTFSKILLPVQEFMKYGNTKYNIPLPLAYTRANISKDPLLMTDLHNVFFVMSVDVENSKYSVVFNEMMPGEFDYNYADYPALTNLRLFNGKTDDIPKIKRLIVYDRALTKDEIIELREKIMLLYYTQWYNSSTFVQGMTGFGSPSAYQVKSSERLPEFINTPIESGEHTITVNGENRTFTNVDPGEPAVEDNMSYVEALYWLNPIESLNVGDMYNIEAMVYPYDITKNSYNVEYVSSDPSVIECYYGVLIAKSSGSATITAKASNTTITCTLDITVSETETVNENYFYPSESYIYNGSHLVGGTSVATLKAIIGAIDEAAASGYNGVVFPKTTYHIKPFKSGVQCYIPTDFTVDFNNSYIYVDDNDYCHTTDSRPDHSVNPYIMFSFSGFKVTDDEGNQIEDKYYMSCKNSVVKNMHYYGERRLMSDLGYTEGDYGEQVNAFVFSTGAYKCKIGNIDFHDTVGFNISTRMNGFDQWSGTGLDGAVRGCVRYSDFTSGKLDATGLTVNESDEWYHTDFLKLGYNYSDNPSTYTDMKYYKVGKMDKATTYGLTTRWYEIYWFDTDKNLIEYRPHQMTLETYLLPKNAVYFKVNARFPDGAPTSSNEGRVDTPHVIRVWPSVDPDRCYISNCKFCNPHASAISMTGGTNFVLSDIFAENGHSPLGVWSIDYEDGWQPMRHNINYRIICTGILVMPGGHNTATLHSVINTARSGSETEAVKYINCAINILQPSPKTNDMIANVTYRSDISSIKYQLDSARLREINCTKNTAMNVI
nr:MAG TPA: LigB immunoglobulin-like (Big) domain, IMMUNE [Caudoviricetes sp.]